MSLSSRRSNVPSFAEPLPSFQVHTPNRTMHPIRSLPSPASIASYSTTETRNALPPYVAEEDDNPDVITTSVEIDPDAEDGEAEITVPPVVSKPKVEKTIKTRSGLAKLFSRSVLIASTTPGVRLTTKRRLLRSNAKDARHGFPVNLPVVDGEALVDTDKMSYAQLMSRINILLANGGFDDARLLLESNPSFGDHMSLVKYADCKKHEHELIQVHDLPRLSREVSRNDAMDLLTVPELDASRDDSDDSASDYTFDRRGSIASCNSAASSKSSLSQRIRSRLERREEWCIIFD